jgi:superfamily I DNA and/or RNA helicase
VAQRVIHHYINRPDLSLGVVAFGEAQAEAIETALGQARKLHPGLDRFFGADRLRGFFVKTAAAAQGDERDVLILSVGYGPDEKGQVTTDFGPLSGPLGWRLLNVAITRARYRAEIVTSIRASDIPESVSGEGVQHLRRYLHYAAQAWPKAITARVT